jgi:hypothetical protein
LGIVAYRWQERRENKERSVSRFQGSPYLAILSGKEEDRFTYFLRELLLAPKVLERFLTKFCGLPANAAATAHADLQVTVDGGRPDLAVRTDDLYLLFEAKVDSWLHKDQLVPYATACANWAQGHSAGVCRLYVIASQRNVEQQVATGRADLAAANLSAWNPAGIAWEQIAIEFAALAKDVETQDPKLALHLDGFAGLVLYKFGELERPFTREETGLLQEATVPGVLSVAIRLMDKTRDALLALGFDIAVSNGRNFFGYNINRAGKNWWYGIWVDAWQQVGQSPLFLQFPDLAAKPPPTLPPDLEPLIAAKLDPARLAYYIVPLPLRPDVEMSRLADEHAALINRYCC